ncbi:MAG: hypothetical protein OJF60_001994 [Burkholderiaceae bacterium]|jgi:glutaredoxin|nr:MAG: hypothetical protein OJF60_001994 [Burkholderiaceae bacterium]
MKTTLAITLVAGAMLAGLVASDVQAQTVYRIVRPDGSVTFSDKPPMSGTASTVNTDVGGASPAGAALPYELQQVAAKYPVTLYSGPDCGPCAAGRALLTRRGVPFTERTVSTQQDLDALQRLSGGDASLPLLTIGGQRLKGFSDAEWGEYLDAAGYPKSSQLPAGYRNPPARPLVAAQQLAPPAEKPAAPRAAPTAPAPRRADEDNPAGIRF